MLTRIMRANFLGRSDRFPETSSNFSVKNWYFLSANKCLIIYKGFLSTAKTLPHLFIHNFWTESFQTKYEYILKTRKTVLHHIVNAEENRKIGLDPPPLALKSKHFKKMPCPPPTTPQALKLWIFVNLHYRGLTI